MAATEGFAPDGSPVSLYARLKPMREPELIHAFVPAEAEILKRFRATGLRARNGASKAEYARGSGP